jgi:GTP-binding protein
LLLHIADATSETLTEDIALINAELAKFNAELAQKPQILVINKLDLLNADMYADINVGENVGAANAARISAATGDGVNALMHTVIGELAALPPIIRFDPDYIEPERFTETADDLVLSGEDGEYYVEGAWIERLLDRVNLTDTEGRAYFDQTLRRCGVYERLETLGMRSGDTLCVYNWQFDYN